MMTLYARYLCAGMLIVLLSITIAFGATLSVTPSGEGVFVIQGAAMDDVAGIDLIVEYDKTLLSSPKIDKGSFVSANTLFTANAAFAPNALKIAMIGTTPFSGGGSLAVISFAAHSGTGTISVSASMINSKGAPVSSGEKISASDFQTFTTGTTGIISNPGIPFSQTPAVQQPAPRPTVPVGSIPVYAGTVSMPGEGAAVRTAPPVEQINSAPPQPATGYSQPVRAAEQAAEEPPQETKQESSTQIVHTAVMDRFRTYQGEKSPAILVALFKKDVAAGIRQQPAIAVSDGISAVSLGIELPPSNVSPNFALTGAKLVSITRDGKNGAWLVEVLPHASAIKVTVSVIFGTSSIEYPMTVIPPVNGTTAFTEKSFAGFLKESGTSKLPSDLNGDGKRDYIDDYIYTGYYLLKKETEKVRQQIYKKK